MATNDKAVIDPKRDMAKAFHHHMIVERVLWCRAAGLANAYICPLKIGVHNMEEFHRLTSFEAEQGVWKIAVFRHDGFNAAGRPAKMNLIHFMKERVQRDLGHTTLKIETDRFGYDEMMAIMKRYYSPSLPDPLSRYPDHISDELKTWERRRLEQEIAARKAAAERQPQ